MDVGAEANFLTRLQHLSDVAHPSDLSHRAREDQAGSGVIMVPRSERVGEGYSDAQR